MAETARKNYGSAIYYDPPFVYPDVHRCLFVWAKTNGNYQPVIRFKSESSDVDEIRIGSYTHLFLPGLFRMDDL